MAYHIIRRGRGIFKILFVIDDFIRLFAMTLLIPIFFTALGGGPFIRTLGVILGAIIDIQDFVADAGIAKFKDE